jgi:hypothetical protein
VIVGLSGTPLCDVPLEAQALQNLIKGRHHAQLTDEGFVSYYMQTPTSVFPTVLPRGLPHALPAAAVRAVPLRNLPISLDERRKKGTAGNRREYELKVADELQRLGLRDADDDAGGAGGGGGVAGLDTIKLGTLSRLCAVSQTFSYAGRDDVARVVHGASGKLLKREVSAVEYGEPEQIARARGYASKLLRIVEDVANAREPTKTLIIVHRCTRAAAHRRRATRTPGPHTASGVTSCAHARPARRRCAHNAFDARVRVTRLQTVCAQVRWVQIAAAHDGQADRSGARARLPACAHRGRSQGRIDLRAAR